MQSLKYYKKLLTLIIYYDYTYDNKKTSSLEKSTLKIELTDSISDNMIFQKYTRCTIPKRDLNLIL